MKAIRVFSYSCGDNLAAGGSIAVRLLPEHARYVSMCGPMMISLIERNKPDAPQHGGNPHGWEFTSRIFLLVMC